jgi:hypothetical protein
MGIIHRKLQLQGPGDEKVASVRPQGLLRLANRLLLIWVLKLSIGRTKIENLTGALGETRVLKFKVKMMSLKQVEKTILFVPSPLQITAGQAKRPALPIAPHYMKPIAAQHSLTHSSGHRRSRPQI